MKKLTYSDAVEIVLSRDMKLVWTEEEFNKNYIGANKPIPIICVCEREKMMSLSSVKFGKKCQDCGKNRKKTYEEAQKIVQEFGMQLVWSKDEFTQLYKGMNKVLPVICLCGSLYSVRLNDIIYGYSCKDCGKKKQALTLFTKYGKETVLLPDGIKNKIKLNNIREFGFEYHNEIENTVQILENIAKIKETNMVQFGKEFPNSYGEIQEKFNTHPSEKPARALATSKAHKVKTKFRFFIF